MESYGIAVVVDGDAEINGVKLEKGDRVFVSESEKTVSLSGKAVILVARP